MFLCVHFCVVYARNLLLLKSPADSEPGDHVHMRVKFYD